MTKQMRLIRLITLSALAAVGGCSADRDPATLFAPDSGVLVIDAAMIVGHDYPTVFLTETVAANAVFDIRSAAVSGATIEISGGGITMAYDGPLGFRGVYIPRNPDRKVLESTTYRIEVTTVDGRFLTATTRTPKKFAVDRWVLLDDAGRNVTRELKTFLDPGDPYDQPENQLTYTEGLLEAWYRETAQPGYQIALFSLDAGSPLLIDPDFLDEDDLADIERTISSPPLSDQAGTIRMPWFAIAYEGRYKIKIYTLDRNWYDFARSDPTLSGGFGFGGNVGDNFERPIFHVEGGIGLFGAAAVDSIGVYFHPRP